MRTRLPLLTVLVCAVALVGCQGTFQHDNLVHAIYDCPVHQALIQFNDATDVHALADTELAYRWCELMDDLGADAYYELHLLLNPPID